MPCGEQKHVKQTSRFWSSMEEAWKLSLYPDNKWNAKQTEKSTHFPRSFRGERSQSKPLPRKLEIPIGKYRQSQLTGAKPSWGPVPRFGNLNSKWWIAGGSAYQVWERNSRGTQSLGDLDTFVSVTSFSIPGSYSEYLRKIPFCFQQGERRGAFETS